MGLSYTLCDCPIHEFYRNKYTDIYKVTAHGEVCNTGIAGCDVGERWIDLCNFVDKSGEKFKLHLNALSREGSRLR